MSNEKHCVYAVVGLYMEDDPVVVALFERESSANDFVKVASDYDKLNPYPLTSREDELMGRNALELATKKSEEKAKLWRENHPIHYFESELYVFDSYAVKKMPIKP